MSKSKTEAEVESKLHELIDAIETAYGEVEGFEVRLEHPVVDGERQAFANVKEFTLIHLHRTKIDFK
jgi:hypothetical protein